MKVLKLYKDNKEATKSFIRMVRTIEGETNKTLTQANFTSKTIYIAGIDYSFVGAEQIYKIRGERIDKVVIDGSGGIPQKVINLANNRANITRGRI